MDVFSDEEKNFKGLFFQDASMMQCFSAYPEIIFLDATYKLLEIGLPTYLLLCEDSNGLSEIVFVCLLVTEDQDSMQWMLGTFKKNNPSWPQVRIVMADKDIGERDVVKSNLPAASVLICLFHALRTFRREVSCEKLGITAGERVFSLGKWPMLHLKKATEVFIRNFKKVLQNRSKTISRITGLLLKTSGFCISRPNVEVF